MNFSCDRAFARLVPRLFGYDCNVRWFTLVLSPFMSPFNPKLINNLTSLGSLKKLFCTSQSFFLNQPSYAYPVLNLRYGEKQRKADPSKELTGIQLLSATAYQLKKPNQQLLIPITLWIGMEQAFIGADYTQVRILIAGYYRPWDSGSSKTTRKYFYSITSKPLPRTILKQIYLLKIINTILYK